MRKLYLALLIGLGGLSLAAQQFDQPSVGPGYSNQTFYTLNDGATQSHANTAWDIAFSTGPQDAGIFINEAVATAQGPPPPEVELYLLAGSDFSNADTAGMLRLYNDETSWSEGAFNHVKAPSDPLDLGWGSYNVVNNQVLGTRLYGIKLRDGSFKKLEIQSLAGGVYTFRYADLDGSGEQTQTIDKAAHAGSTLAYFSFASGEVVDLEPDTWDLLFTRYVTPLDDGQGNILDYVVTGVLSKRGVEVAQADDTDPATVDYRDYEDELSSVPDVIGYDWKEIDLSTFQWLVIPDRVYFVKTTSNELWKVEFIDFEGSATGVSTLERTFVTQLTSTEEADLPLESFTLYPNPVADQVTLAVESEVGDPRAEVRIANSLGQVLFFRVIDIQPGWNVQTFFPDLPSGTYYLSLQMDEGLISQPLLVK